MSFAAFAPVIGAGISAIGQHFTNQQNAANAQQQMAMQLAFAKNAIQWKVADAQKAGVHPLFALGASTSSYSPVSVGASNPLSSFSGLGDAFKDGQDTSRANAATAPAAARGAAKVLATNAVTQSNIDTEEKGLRLEVLRLQVARLQQQMNPPAPTLGNPLSYEFPGAGGNTSHINPDPMKTTPGAPGQPSSEGGAIPDVGYARTTTGWAPVPSKDVKERIEDQAIPEAMWTLRNNILPTFGYNRAPPPFPAPAGQGWIYDAFRQEYRLKPLVRSKIYGDERPAGWYIR